MDAAAAQRVDVENISRLNLIRRVGWSIESPSDHMTLRQWLTSPPDDLLLQTRRTRTRKPDRIADGTMRAIRGFAPEWDACPARTPRTSRPAPRTAESMTIVRRIAPDVHSGRPLPMIGHASPRPRG